MAAGREAWRRGGRPGPSSRRRRGTTTGAAMGVRQYLSKGRARYWCRREGAAAWAIVGRQARVKMIAHRGRAAGCGDSFSSGTTVIAKVSRSHLAARKVSRDGVGIAREADGRTKTNVAPKDVQVLFFLVVGDILLM